MWAVQLYGRLLFPVHPSLVVNIASDLQWVIFPEIPFETSHNAAHSSFNIDPPPIMVHCDLSYPAEMITFRFLQTTGITSCRATLGKRASCKLLREKLLVWSVARGRKGLPVCDVCWKMTKGSRTRLAVSLYTLNQTCLRHLGATVCASLLPRLIRCGNLASSRMHHLAQQLHIWEASSGGYRVAPMMCISALKWNSHQSKTSPSQMLRGHTKKPCYSQLCAPFSPCVFALQNKALIATM